MISIIKGVTGKMVHRKPSDWNHAAPRILLGYRRRDLMSGVSPFQFLHGVSSLVSFEQLPQFETEGPAFETRIAEILALDLYRATHVAKNISFFIKALPQKGSM